MRTPSTPNLSEQLQHHGPVIAVLFGAVMVIVLVAGIIVPAMHRRWAERVEKIIGG